MCSSICPCSLAPLLFVCPPLHTADDDAPPRPRFGFDIICTEEAPLFQERMSLKNHNQSTDCRSPSTRSSSRPESGSRSMSSRRFYHRMRPYLRPKRFHRPASLTPSNILRFRQIQTRTKLHCRPSVLRTSISQRGPSHKCHIPYHIHRSCVQSNNYTLDG